VQTSAEHIAELIEFIRTIKWMISLEIGGWEISFANKNKFY